MAVEHVMFKFENLKVNSCDDRQTDRMTTKVLSSRPHIKCGENNKGAHINVILLPKIVLSIYSIKYLVSTNKI